MFCTFNSTMIKMFHGFRLVCCSFKFLSINYSFISLGSFVLEGYSDIIMANRASLLAHLVNYFEF